MIRIRIWIGNRVESRIRIRIGINMMSIHNTSKQRGPEGPAKSRHLLVLHFIPPFTFCTWTAHASCWVARRGTLKWGCEKVMDTKVPPRRSTRFISPSDFFTENNRKCDHHSTYSSVYTLLDNLVPKVR
jgi:hypothetical protein